MFWPGSSTANSSPRRRCSALSAGRQGSHRQRSPRCAGSTVRASHAGSRELGAHQTPISWPIWDCWNSSPPRSGGVAGADRRTGQHETPDVGRGGRRVSRDPAENLDESTDSAGASRIARTAHRWVRPMGPRRTRRMGPPAAAERTPWNHSSTPKRLMEQTTAARRNGAAESS